MRMQEKRSFIRWKAQSLARFKLVDHEGAVEKIASLRDISFSGAQISLEDRLRLDDKLNMALEIPDAQDPIICQGKVVWQNSVDEAGRSRSVCGLFFVRLKDQDKEKIFRYVWDSASEEMRRKWWDGVK